MNQEQMKFEKDRICAHFEKTNLTIKSSFKKTWKICLISALQIMFQYVDSCCFKWFNFKYLILDLIDRFYTKTHRGPSEPLNIFQLLYLFYFF